MIWQAAWWQADILANALEAFRLILVWPVLKHAENFSARKTINSPEIAHIGGRMELGVAGALVHEAHHALNGELGDREVVLVFHAQIQVLADHDVAVQFAFGSKDRAVVAGSARQHDRACVRLLPELDHILVAVDVLRFTAGKFSGGSCGEKVLGEKDFKVSRRY